MTASKEINVVQCLHLGHLICNDHSFIPYNLAILVNLTDKIEEGAGGEGKEEEGEGRSPPVHHHKGSNL